MNLPMTTAKKDKETAMVDNYTIRELLEMLKKDASWESDATERETIADILFIRLLGNM